MKTCPLRFWPRPSARMKVPTPRIKTLFRVHGFPLPDSSRPTGSAGQHQEGLFLNQDLPPDSKKIISGVSGLTQNKTLKELSLGFNCGGGNQLSLLQLISHYLHFLTVRIALGAEGSGAINHPRRRSR